MTLSTSLRKAVLLTHITCSVGWMGAVAAFLVLAITGTHSADTVTVRAVYIAMEPMTSGLIVPLAFASLLSGLLLAFGTRWGLIRHYWVLVKLLINSLSIALLLLHTRLIHQAARAAETGPLSPTTLSGARSHLVNASALALLALLTATLLSVYKPRGLTPYGQASVKG